MSVTTSSGKCSAPASSSTVVRGWAPLTTSGARISSPESSVTPVVRPSRTSIERTPAPVRIVAPEWRALAAMACEMPPIPPFTWPHSPLTPSSSPSAWWSRLYAVPGVRGPAQTPTTPVDARHPLIASDSNHSSSRSPTDIVITRNRSCTSRCLSPAARPASRSSDSRSPGRFEPSAGGGRSISGRRNAAIRASSSSNSG